jgi:hypothetical protein
MARSQSGLSQKAQQSVSAPHLQQVAFGDPCSLSVMLMRGMCFLPEF